MKINNWLIPGMITLILLGGVLLLGFMQLDWVRKASEAASESFHQGMELSVYRGVEKAMEEMEELIILLQISPRDFKARRWNSFLEAMDYLAENSPYYSALTGVYLLPLEEGLPPLVYRNREMEETEPPPGFINYKQILTEESVWEIFMRQEKESIVLTTIEGDPSTRPLGLMVFQFDLPFIYSHLLPEYMKKALDGYPFIIQDGTTQYYKSPLLSGNKNYINRKADFNIFLENNFPRRFRPVPPLVKLRVLTNLFLFRRNLLLNEPPPPDEEEAGSNKEQLLIKIYYPRGPFNQIMSRQTLINQITGFGFLLILFFGLLFLYRLYTRTKRSREKEQEFVATMSHELRTPISVIQSTSDNLARGIIKDPEKVMKYGIHICKQTKRLARMVENILLYAGLEGRQKSNINGSREVEMGAFFTELLEGMEEIIREKNASIEMGEGFFNGILFTDPLALRMVVENLLVNALRHGGGGIIRINCRRRIKQGLGITIEDEGPGIPPGEHKKVFEPFFRGNRSVEEHIPGSGLGLHLVKRIVQLQGGYISLESPYRNIRGDMVKGCRFSVDLPLKIKE